jgi:iron complex transport system ATP-binding protein
MSLLAHRSAEGRAVLASMHDLNLAVRHFTRLIVLRQGHIIAQGTPREVVDSGALSQAFDVEVRAAAGASELVLTTGGLDAHAG